MMTMLVLLRDQPHSGRKTSIPSVRRLSLAPYPYLIDYFFEQEEIVVLRFRHAARRPLP